MMTIQSYTSETFVEYALLYNIYVAMCQCVCVNLKELARRII